MKSVPMRMCVACRVMQPKKDLVRIVRTPQDEVILDDSGKKNGRGAYLCKNPACLMKAQKSKALERALQKTIDAAVYQRLSAELSNEQQA